LRRRPSQLAKSRYCPSKSRRATLVGGLPSRCDAISDEPADRQENQGAGGWRHHQEHEQRQAESNGNRDAADRLEACPDL
jgi:hypothetical protein